MNTATEGFIPCVETIENMRHALRRGHPFNLPAVNFLCDSALRNIGTPKVVTLCGSSRFVDVMAVCAWIIERDEKAIAMALHLLPLWYSADLPDDHLAEHEGVSVAMDALHLRKIDMATEIFVVNRRDYIGDSTRREIEHAKALGKPIRWYTGDPVGREAEERIAAFLQKPARITKPIDDEAFLRSAFERMHQGRNLTRHHLRGTYSSPQIAALWNQHIRTAKLMAEAAKTEARDAN